MYGNVEAGKSPYPALEASGDKMLSTASPVQGSLMRLSNRILTANDTLSKLEERLRPALSPPRPTAERAISNEKPPACGLVGEIDAISERTDSLCQRLDDLISRTML